MTLLRWRTSDLMLMLGLMLLLASGAPLVQAQKREAPVATLAGAVVDDNTNLDIEIYLLAASDAGAIEGGKLPSSLEPVVRQLRSTLPFGSYRLTATMMNRIRNGGRLEVKGVGGTPFPKVNTLTPLFSEYSVRAVELKTDAAGQSIVDFTDFRYGARVPVQTSSVAAASGGALATTPPVIQYENTGISTGFSMREGEPVIVGTLNVGQSGEAFILVVSAKRTSQR